MKHLIRNMIIVTLALVGPGIGLADQFIHYPLAGGSSLSIGDIITSGTAGSVLFIDSNVELAQDNSNFFFDATNHRLGLLTTAPATTLDIGGAKFEVNATGNLVKINNVAASFPASQGAASTLLRNDGSGNLTWLLGTATPTANDVVLYDASGNLVAHETLLTSTANNDMFINVNAGNLGFTQFGNADIGVVLQGVEYYQFNTVTAAESQFLARHNRALVLGVDGTAAGVGTVIRQAAGQTADILEIQKSDDTVYANFDVSGNFGIGNGATAPKATLDINGYMKLAKYAFGTPPVACTAGQDGTIFLTTTYHMCVCKGGSTAYVLVSDGSTACS